MRKHTIKWILIYFGLFLVQALLYAILDYLGCNVVVVF